ncbi:MAG: ABC transporter ATP-binding protein [Pseudorhodoplanes sp.]
MIQIRGLSKRFSRSDYASLDDFSLDIAEGSFFTLLGPSGCGKSTTLRCIAGLERPDEGSLKIGDTLVFSAKEGIFVPPYRRDMGMVFQSYAVWPHMTVFDNVAYPLRNVGTPKAELTERVTETLRLVGLERYSSRSATLLSGGEQQRVALARALVHRPRVLLFDEPLSNLDAKLREDMRAELRALHRKLGFTAVFVTHDQEEAFSLSDHMAVMNRGRIQELGVPQKLYETPATQFGAEFLGAASKLEGVVQSRAGEPLRVETPIGVVPCRSQNPVDAGKQVVVYIRPSDIRPASSEGGRRALKIEAKVQSVEFIGALLHWSIVAGDGVVLRGQSLTGSDDAAALAANTGRNLSVLVSESCCVPTS